MQRCISPRQYPAAEASQRRSEVELQVGAQTCNDRHVEEKSVAGEDARPYVTIYKTKSE